MASTLNDNLAQYGINLMGAMERMDNNIDLYKKLALKYLNNANYSELIAAMEVKDFDTGYRTAHSLKGVAGNLSFDNLFSIASIISDALYQGEYQAAEREMPELAKAQEKVMAGLAKWQAGEF